MFRCEGCGKHLDESDVSSSGGDRYHSRPGRDGMLERCGPVSFELDEEKILRWSKETHLAGPWSWHTIKDEGDRKVFLPSECQFRAGNWIRFREFLLVCTSEVVPEQYNVYWRGIPVGYLRLRGGVFRADAPVCMADTVYMAEPEGRYRFEDSERERYLEAALESIRRKMFDVAKAD